MIAHLLAISSMSNASFRLEVKKDAVWLVHGSKRLQIPKEGGNFQWSYMPEDLSGWPIGNGKILRRAERGPREWELLDLAITKSGKEIERLNFETLSRKWLADDSLFGGHKKANDLRYLTSRCWLSEVALAPGAKPTWAWGVVAYQNTSESKQPILDQALVKIEWAPNLRATFVREIGTRLNYEKFGTPSLPRLFHISGRLIVGANDGAYSANDDGALSKLEEAANPLEAPIGQAGDKTIVYLNTKDHNVRLWSPKGLNRTFPITDEVIYGWPMPVQYSRLSLLIGLGADVLDTVTGKRITLKEKPPFIVWENYAIAWDGTKARIYNGKTGKIVGSASR